MDSDSDSIVDLRPSRPKKSTQGQKPDKTTSSITQSGTAVHDRSIGYRTHPTQPPNSFSTQSGIHSNANLKRANSGSLYNRPHVETKNIAVKEQHRTSTFINQGAANSNYFKGKSPASSAKTRNQSKQGCPSCSWYPQGFLTCSHCNAEVRSSSFSSPTTSSKQDPSDNNVPSGATNTVFTCRARSSNNQDGWYFGAVKGQPLEDTIYVKPMKKLPKEFLANKDVYIRKDRIPGCSSLLSVKDGDKIEFLLSTKPQNNVQTPQGIKPSAYKANIQSFCAPRSLDELKLYFTLAKHRVGETSARTEAMNSIMMCDALWFYIFNAKCGDTEIYQIFVSEVLDFVFLLANHMDSFPSRRREIIGLIVEKNFIENLKSGKDKESKGLRFAKLAITLEPALLKKVMPLLSSLVKNSDSDLASGLYDMLLKVGSVSDLSNWHDLAQIPTIEELFGDPLEKVKYLRPVLLSSGYKDTDDYLNVYYRLLRTECFSAIQKGIADMKMGELDARDMSIYEKVFVRNIDMEHSSILISLQFSLEKSVSNWKKSKKLMFGNLLCITIKGDFSDPIWLTVADRDENILQKHSVIGVELISFHSSDADAAAIIKNLMLHSGKMIMAESPTYFQSFQHVLTSLKNSEISKFCLVNEIVHGTFKKSVNCHSLISPYLKNVDYEQLEENQKRAFLHVLESTLGIIQGPPGTGKTYVGAKLAQMFLCLQDGGNLNKLLDVGGCYPNSSAEDGENISSMSEDNPPILILTYKNHALDEFLKHCTEFCDKEYITRIGSQSKEDVLKNCLLHNKMKSSKIRRIPTGYVIEQIKELFLKLSFSLSELEKSRVFTLVTFISRLSLEQLINFIGNAIKKPWKSPPKSMNVNVQTMQSYYTKWKEADDFREKILQLISQPALDHNQGTQEERIERSIARKVKDAYENHWLPNKQNLISLTQLQQRGAAFFNTYLIDSTEDEDIIDDLVNDALGEDIDDLDEDYINEQLSLRISAFDEDHTGNYRSKDIKSQKMARLEAIIAKAKMGQSMNNKSIFCLSDFPPSCAVSQGILRNNELWSLSDIEKYTFIYSFLHSGCNELMDKMNDMLEEINILQKQKELIDHNNKLQVLKTQKIVGATIIGASVQLSLINKLAPKVVLVEEAAEVLESCLVAVLSKSVQKLILIGDHKQLKPQVDTYHLRREHKFHISMMERLIMIGFPYEKLQRQGRMRPEFSCMLKDIYPEYQDFPSLEVKNKKIMCLPDSMFFWSHQFPENKDRSVKNFGEANMVVALALFFITSGVDESDITILCAYLGQVQLVRKLYRGMNPLSPSRDITKQLIDIRTIDEYQGDENRFVIVSLTRSNPYGKIGFLKEIERRCVAQSRAKCGLYFVGNGSMFRKSKTWKIVMDTMDGHNLISERLPVTCYRHPDIIYSVVQKDDLTKKRVVDNSQLMYYVQNNNNWCKVICNSSFPCGIKAHRCEKLCTPRHDDSKCLTMVKYTFAVCQHTTQKYCYIDEKDMKCKTKILVKLPSCGHEKKVECHEWLFEKNGIICTETCSKIYDCPYQHKCEKICGRPHEHSAGDCPVQVEFVIPKCKHTAHFQKVCGKPIPKVKCKFKLKYKSVKCGHEQSRQCSEEEECEHICSKQRPDCGHPCANICSKSCLEVDCQICTEEYQKSLHAAKILAEEQLKICKLNEAEPGFFKLLHMSNSEMVNITGVKEKCDLFLSLYSTSRVKDITSVWKVQCPHNLSLFWEYASKANGIVREELYKLSSGFLETIAITSKDDMFAYLWQKSSNRFEFVKYAGNRIASLPGNEYTLAITEVLLGDSIDSEKLIKEKPTKESVTKFLEKKKKDSVITKSTNGPPIYSVYEPSQIHLKFIVHFTTEKFDANKALVMQDALKSLPEGETEMAISQINLRDVSDPLIEMVQRAIALYKGDCSLRGSYAQQRQPLKEIKSVGIVVNHQANQAYDEKVKQSKEKCKGKQNFVEVFAYHATKPENVGSIIRTNLDPGRAGSAHGAAHGRGCYFSEHPEFSFNYGQQTMLIFKLLLIEGQHRKVQPDGKGFCQQLVLNDASMFKPQFVLRF